MRAILVNIFGGIARGDEVARGLVEARAQQTRDVPMVVRIVGTNADLAAEHPARRRARASRPHPASTRPWSEPSRSRRAGGMSILVDERTRLLVQGITGREGLFHATQMQEYGTNIVAGTTPGKGGQTVLGNVPVFDTVRAGRGRDRRQHHGHLRARRRALRTPSSRRSDAGIGTIFCITEHIPVLDMLKVVAEVEARGRAAHRAQLPRRHVARQGQGGHHPGLHPQARVDVGLVSRSGTLTYEVVQALTDAGIGQSTCVGIGGDPIAGTIVHGRPGAVQGRPRHRRRIVLMGEIGGGAEEAAAAWRAANMPDVPMVAFIAGRTAPPGRRMGHAGRHHQRQRRHRRGQDRGARGGRHPGRRDARAPSRRLLREAGYSPAPG